jgi:hypothetical protein
LLSLSRPGLNRAAATADAGHWTPNAFVRIGRDGQIVLTMPYVELIGTRAKRLDTPSKVNGTAVYRIDVRPPGANIATLARSPVFGGRLKSLAPQDGLFPDLLPLFRIE